MISYAEALSALAVYFSAQFLKDKYGCQNIKKWYLSAYEKNMPLKLSVTLKTGEIYDEEIHIRSPFVFPQNTPVGNSCVQSFPSSMTENLPQLNEGKSIDIPADRFAQNYTPAELSAIIAEYGFETYIHNNGTLTIHKITP